MPENCNDCPCGVLDAERPIDKAMGPTEVCLRCSHKEGKNRKGSMTEVPEWCPLPDHVQESGMEEYEFKILVVSRCADCGWCRPRKKGDLVCRHFKWEKTGAVQLHLEIGPAKIDPQKEIHQNCPLTTFTGAMPVVEVPTAMAVDALEEAKEALTHVMELAGDSDGIAGFHLNGDLESWDETTGICGQALDKIEGAL